MGAGEGAVGLEVLLLDTNMNNTRYSITWHGINLFFVRGPNAGSQGHTVSRSQAAGDVLEDPDPVLHEPEECRVPGEPVAVRHATTPDDSAQWQHDQAHVVAAADP